MARESALWTRLSNGGKVLRKAGHSVDLQRIENCATSGHPDVEGWIDVGQTWIELKSEMRPARPTTIIHPKSRPSQSIWHRNRAAVGCRIHWVLLQVGESTTSSLYLIPGNCYDQIEATEAELAWLSVCPPNASVPDVLLRSVQGW